MTLERVQRRKEPLPKSQFGFDHNAIDASQHKISFLPNSTNLRILTLCSLHLRRNTFSTTTVHKIAFTAIACSKPPYY